jgi:hypothetical protein
MRESSDRFQLRAALIEPAALSAALSVNPADTLCCGDRGPTLGKEELKADFTKQI